MDHKIDDPSCQTRLHLLNKKTKIPLIDPSPVVEMADC